MDKTVWQGLNYTFKCNDNAHYNSGPRHMFAHKLIESGPLNRLLPEGRCPGKRSPGWKMEMFNLNCTLSVLQFLLHIIDFAFALFDWS